MYGNLFSHETHQLNLNHLYLQDASSSTPIIVFLSPGVDVAASVEGMGRKMGFIAENGMFSVVSLGQVFTYSMAKSYMPKHFKKMELNIFTY